MRNIHFLYTNIGLLRVLQVKNDLSFKYNGPHRNLYAFNLYSVDGDVLKFGEASEQRKLGDKGKICTVLDKGKALDSLLKEVKAAGVEVFPGTVATGVSKTDGSVTVTTNTGKDLTGNVYIKARGGFDDPSCQMDFWEPIRE